MYNQTFTRGNVDYGSAIAVVIVVLGVLLAQIASRLPLDAAVRDALQT